MEKSAPFPTLVSTPQPAVANETIPVATNSITEPLTLFGPLPVTPSNDPFFRSQRAVFLGTTLTGTGLSE